MPQAGEGRVPKTFVSKEGLVGLPWTRANAPTTGLRYGIHPKFFTSDIVGGLPKGCRSNSEIGVICLDFASSAHAPVVESDGEDRVLTIGLTLVLFRRLANDTSVLRRGFPGEYGEKTATSGEILGEDV